MSTAGSSSNSSLKKKYTNEPYETAVFRSFGESNFKVVYDERANYKHSANEQKLRMLHSSLEEVGVPKSMVTSNKETGESLSLADEQAIYLWTLDDDQRTDGCATTVYKAVNQALLEDDPEELRKYGYIMRAINAYIVNRPAPRSAILYRGTKIELTRTTEEGVTVPKQGVQIDASAGIEGTIFRQPWYVAASSDLSVVVENEFAQKGSPLLEFHVVEGCPNCTPIPDRLSHYPEEKEWLMPPYTPVQYIKQRREVIEGLGETLIVSFEVLDGMAVAEEHEANGLTIKVFVTAVPRT